MKKSLYTKTIKEIAKWTGQNATEVDTSAFRYANNPQFKIERESKTTNESWFILADYNQSEQDGKSKPVSDRSMSLYFRESVNKGGDFRFDLDRSIHITECDTEFRSSIYTHQALIDVRVNGKCVAYYIKEIDLYDYDGKIINNLGDVICGMIFNP